MRSKQRTAELPSPFSRPIRRLRFPGVLRLAASALLFAAFAGAPSGCVSLNGADPTKRTPREVVADQRIERQVARQLAADAQLASSHVNVVSYDGIVLLTGQVEGEALRRRCESAAGAVDGVRKIHNEVQVGGATNFVSRVNDGWLAAKVFSRFASSPEVDAASMKVVAENGVVYLLGLVPPAQGHAAAEAARTVFGVRKVVKVFDYLEGS